MLVKAFNQVLKRIKDKEVYHVALESVSIVDSMTTVMDRLTKNKQGSFSDLLVEDYTKAHIVGTLLALLELCKRQILVVSQDLESSEILISLAHIKSEDLSSFYSEYDHKVAV